MEDTSKNPKSRFRSAVFTVIAISRMKSLVQKWKSRQNSSALKARSELLMQKPARTNSQSSVASFNSQSQTDATLQEYVARLHKLHDTLGLRSNQS